MHKFLLQKISHAKTPKKISRWINKLHLSIKHIRNEVQRDLTNKRVIRMQQKRFLFFKWKSPVIINKQLVYRLVGEVESQVFKGTNEEDELILLSFIKPAKLLRRLFPEKQRRKQAEVRLNQMLIDNQVSQAVTDAISAAQMVAASVATTTAATSAATT